MAKRSMTWCLKTYRSTWVLRTTFSTERAIMFQRNLLFLCESILLVIALAVVVAAQDETPLQVTNQNRSGDLPFSTSIGTGAEQVDVASGTLKIRIPIISIKGRGLDYKFMLRYDTAFWATATRFQTGTGY